MFYFGHWNIYDTYVIVLLFTNCYVTFTLDIFFTLGVCKAQFPKDHNAIVESYDSSIFDLLLKDK